MFGQLVSDHRRRLALTQEELAHRTGLSERTIRRLEVSGGHAPRPSSVRLLADTFGLDGDERQAFVDASHTESGGTSRETAPARPAQLPADVAGFTGRRDALAFLDGLLAPAGARSPTMVAAAISGTAGVGKTALAVHWAHRVRDRFPDGQLYVNLRGFDPTGAVMAPAQAIRRFLDALAVPARRIPAELDAQVDLYRTILADRSMLVVLDNARDPGHVRPLLPGAPGCVAMVTSRNRLAGLVAATGASALPLDLLSRAEAGELIDARLGSVRAMAEPAAVDEIITGCAGLPLALAVVTANAAAHPRVPLRTLADRIRRSRTRLDALSTTDAPDTDVRAVFTCSYQALTDEAARLFRLFGLHPGPDITAPAAASLATVPIHEAQSLLTRLAAASLVNEHRPGRYSVHDLLREYATEQAHRVDADEERAAVTHRLLDHYVHSAQTAVQALNPQRKVISLAAPRPGVVPEEPTGHDRAVEWFERERPVLLAVVDHAVATGFDTHAWQLAWTLNTFLNRRGHWHDWISTGRTAVAAATRLADPSAQALAHHNLARAYLWGDRVDDAWTELQHALVISQRVADHIGQADSHLRLANVWERRKDYANALDHAHQAHDLYRFADHEVGRALALNAVGWYRAHLGDRRAVTDCRRALDLLREIGNRPGEASACDSLGYAHHHLGHYDQAIVCFQHSMEIYRDLGHRYYQATALTHLGDSHRATGDAGAARHAWRQAQAILDELDHPDAVGVRVRLTAGSGSGSEVLALPS